ncbi:MAG: hypothetical protein J6A59_12260 [Lachnospiraceae bacterium]|nr:hypothetical protein [Lachnospiraceae bacterium]
MIKLVKTIVDTNRTLLGFVAEGKRSEFGELGKEKVEKSIPVTALIQQGFVNNQIAIVKGKISEKNNFKINDLPMVVFVNNELIPIDNTINLCERFIKDNEPIGFRVKFSDNTECNYTYVQTLQIAKWFKPGNFVVKTSTSGKSFISGKSGIRLEDLKTTIIGVKPEKVAKRTKSGAKTKDNIQSTLKSDCDIMDIYEFIASCGGNIIKLPNDKYVPVGEKKVTTDPEFIPLNIGEIAEPYLRFSATKLNANAAFKKMGKVTVNLAGSPVDMYTYTFNTKTIFLNGKNYMDKFAVAVTPDKEAELINAFGKIMALEKIDDPIIVQPVCSLTGQRALSIYRVNTDKIALIAERKYDSSILSSEQIRDLMIQSYNLELMSKYLSPRAGVIAELKKTLKPKEVVEATGVKINGLFASMNSAGLKAISESGIDIYNGSYKRTVSVTKDADELLEKVSSIEKKDPVEIEYALAGYTVGSKVTGKVIRGWVANNDKTQLPAEVLEKLLPIESETNAIEKLRKAWELNKVIDAQLSAINKKLWMHNCSMFLVSGRAKVHTHDAKFWTPDVNTRVKTALVYSCTKPGCEGLKVKIKGTQI